VREGDGSLSQTFENENIELPATRKIDGGIKAISSKPCAGSNAQWHLTRHVTISNMKWKAGRRILFGAPNN
jgi:hypothetical protein